MTKVDNMTRLDYLAGQALLALMRSDDGLVEAAEMRGLSTAQLTAEIALEFAEALDAELEHAQSTL